MAKKSKSVGSHVKIKDLGQAINTELTLYHESVLEEVNALSEAAVQDLVKKTKLTAPVMTGNYSARIDGKLLRRKRSGDATYVWYVKAPDHRLTHLLVHGYITSKGNRTRRDPFLENAVNEVLSDYEQKVEEAIRK